ncbi:MAG: hypothetical protein M1331_00145 [Candidatus Marsarchaeota archaeon]|nr:hypothetical protein [Candidatus Marsarchaeota archaeon]
MKNRIKNKKTPVMKKKELRGYARMDAEKLNPLQQQFEKLVYSGNIYLAAKFGEDNLLSDDYKKNIAAKAAEKIITRIKENNNDDETPAEYAPEILALFKCDNNLITEYANIACKHYVETRERFSELAYAYYKVARIGKTYGLSKDQFIPFARNAYTNAMKPKSKIILVGFWPKFAENVAIEFELGDSYISKARKKFLDEIKEESQRMEKY